MTPSAPAWLLTLFTIATATQLTGCEAKSDAAKPEAAQSNQASPAPIDSRGFVLVQVNGKGAALTRAIQAEVARAKAQKLKPYVEVWATWCGPCKAIKASLDDPRMTAAFKGSYIIQLDSDQVELEGTGFSGDRIPIFYELDNQGKPTGRKIDGGAWGDNIPANMAPPLKKFFHPV